MNYIFKLLNQKYNLDGTNYSNLGQNILQSQCFIGVIICVLLSFSFYFFGGSFQKFFFFPLSFVVVLSIILTLSNSVYFQLKIYLLLYSAFICVLSLGLLTHSPIIPLILIPLSFSFFVYLNPRYRVASKHFSVFILSGGFLGLYNYLLFPEIQNLYLNIFLGVIVILLSAYNILLFVFLATKTIDLYKEKEMQFNRAQEIADLGSFEYNVQSNQLVWSDKLYRIYGHEPNGFQASFESFLGQMHGEDRKTFLAILDKKMKTGGSFKVRERIIRPNGEERILTTVGSVELDNKGVPMKVAGICRDITESEITDIALKQSESRYQALFENTFDGILIFDIDQKTNIDCNEKLCSYFGLSRASILESPSFEFLLKNNTQTQDIQDTFQHLNKILETEDSVEIECEHLHKGGIPFSSEITILKLPSPNKNLGVLILKDVTEQVKWKRDLIKKNEELKKYIESNLQLESFAYVASHDLKAPLRTIISFSQLLKRNTGKNLAKPEREYLDFIINATHNLNDLVEALLQFSTIGSKEKQIQPFDIKVLLQTVIQELKIDIDNNDTQVIIKQLPKIITGDITRIRQLFQNLISNSIKFRNKDAQSYIIIDCKEEAEHFLFSVSDNGIGIKSVYLQKIFVMFRKLHTSDQYEGTGMGLAICKRIVDQHNGQIWAESNYGKGTTFFFSIQKEYYTPSKVRKEIQIASN